MTSTPLQIHPWTVLGVARDASPDEIRAAFREKSKKYHPDLGGDEWAFRVVQHAYDSLLIGFETTSGFPATPATSTIGNRGEPWRPEQPWIRHPADPKRQEPPEVPDPPDTIEIEGSWLTRVWPNAVRWFHPRRGRRSFRSGKKATSRHRGKADAGGGSPRPRGPSAEAMLSLKTVEAELVWIRFATEEDAAFDRAARPPDCDDSTLSVCLVVSWPPASVVDSAVQDPDASVTLRSIIEAFEGLKHGAGPTSSRSNIEDGRFVGWLSYADITRAESAFKRFREGVSATGLSIRLRTRQERLPFQWRRRGANGLVGEIGSGGYKPIFSS